MYYRRPLHNLSGVLRPLPTQRYMMMTMGGYWPVIDKLHNGHLGVVTRDSDFHVGERGRLIFVHSPDGGESWSHSIVISQEGSDNRNPGLRRHLIRAPCWRPSSSRSTTQMAVTTS